MANAACWPATCCSDQIRSKESGGIVSQSMAVDNEQTTVNASATLQRFPQQRSIGAAGGGGTLRGIYPESTTTTAAVAVAAAISPSGSSAGSTHLIYNQAEWMYPSLEHRHHHQQQQHQHRANETMDLYYQKKKKRGSNNSSTMAGSTATTTDPLPKEYFYWTEKRLAAASSDGGGGGDLGDVYPSYRKKIPTTEYDEHHQPIADYMRCEAENVENAEDYDEDEDDDEEDEDVDENTGLDHADQMRNMLRYQQQQQQQQFRPGFPLATHPVDGYFNQYEAGNYGPDEPVYEEIMSTRGGGGGSGGHTLRDEQDDDAAAAYRNRLLRLQHLQQQQHHHAEQNIRQSNRLVERYSSLANVKLKGLAPHLQRSKFQAVGPLVRISFQLFIQNSFFFLIQ